ncbi:MAG: SRPBCC domain-containing protein [Reinekea sp.]|jgi:uncharacterized protein YndB with AHSA1/START domain
MTTLYHEIQILTSPDRVWSLLTTRVGLNRWWPGEVSIHGGDSWRFNLADTDQSLVFKVVEEVPDSVLEWLCVQGEDDFHNTLIHWRIEKQEVGLCLVLEHRDLRKSTEQVASLNTQWGIRIQNIYEQLHREIETPDNEDLNAWT